MLFLGEITTARQLADETRQATGQTEAWVLKVLKACIDTELIRSQIKEAIIIVAEGIATRTSQSLQLKHIL